MRNLEAEKLGKRIALTGGASLVILAMGLGIDQGSKPVSAADGTPTPTVAPKPTATPTPDVLATRIANTQATVTAAAGQLEKEKQRIGKEKHRRNNNSQTPQWSVRKSRSVLQ